jgi:hypothetical protein
LELYVADKAERLLCNLARRLDQEASGVAASMLEGLDEMLTVNRLGLPTPLRRCSPAPTQLRKSWDRAPRLSHRESTDPASLPYRPYWQNLLCAIRRIYATRKKYELAILGRGSAEPRFLARCNVILWTSDQ